MALAKRGRPTKSGNHKPRASGRKYLECFFCHTSVSVDADTKAVLCGNCVLGAAGNSAAPKPVGSAAGATAPKLNKDGTPRKARAKNGTAVKAVSNGRGKGWHLRAYFFDTKTSEHFSFGAPVKTAKEIKAAKKAYDDKMATKLLPKIAKKRGRKPGKTAKKVSRKATKTVASRRAGR